ncbi:MAG: hypothetical protein M4579_002273 [Chaenotheca gracillima]|nr:MAG: hypothetical protein M4579_002273 [Chaenotheca gracillima]
MRFFPAATIFLLAPLVRSQAPAPPAAPAPAPNGGQAPPPAPAAPGGGGAAPAPAAPAPGGAAPGGGAPVQTTIQGQVPSVTDITIPSTLPNGQITQIQTVFTQTFGSVPSQYPTAKAGSIGLGSIKGKVGAVKTADAKSSKSDGSPSLSGLGVVGMGAYLSIGVAMAGSAVLGFVL